MKKNTTIITLTQLRKAILKNKDITTEILFDQWFLYLVALKAKKLKK